MKADYSFRLAHNESIAKRLGLSCCSASLLQPPLWSDIPAARKAGEDPHAILQACIAADGIQTPALQGAIRAIGAGSSPWIQVANYLFVRQKANGLITA
jgi:hypothetical protein